MIVRPGDVVRVGIISLAARFIGFAIDGMKIVRGAGESQPDQTRAQVLVIPRQHGAASKGPKASDIVAVGSGQRACRVDREQPELAPLAFSEPNQVGIIAIRVLDAIVCGHVVAVSDLEFSAHSKR